MDKQLEILILQDIESGTLRGVKQGDMNRLVEEYGIREIIFYQGVEEQAVGVLALAQPKSTANANLDPNQLYCLGIVLSGTPSRFNKSTGDWLAPAFAMKTWRDYALEQRLTEIHQILLSELDGFGQTQGDKLRVLISAEHWQTITEKYPADEQGLVKVGEVTLKQIGEYRPVQTQ